MSEVLAYGIDFGTSNSSIASVTRDGEVSVLAVDRAGNNLLRSLVYLNRDGNRLAGDESVRTYLVDGAVSTRCGRCSLVDRTNEGVFTECRQYTSGAGCQDSRLLAQVKTDLASEGLDRTHSWATDFTFVDLVAVMLRRLKREADRSTGKDVRRVALGHPVRFPGVEADPERLQALAEDRLRRAAQLAGFDEVVLVAESQAAVTLEEVQDGLVLCLDFGGGTFDVAVLEKIGSRGEVLALRGVAVGGEAFDSRIFESKMAGALGLDRTVQDFSGRVLSLPNWMRLEFRSLAGLKRLLTDNQVGVLLREIAAQPGGEWAEVLNELLYGGQAYSCYRAVEEAKIALSSDEETRIVFKRAPFIDIDVPFARWELEELIADDLKRVRFCIEDALEDAGVHPDDITYVTRTGGSSQIPAFLTLLDDLFGRDRIVERNPFDTVVTGLAKFAFSEWRDSA